MKRRVMSFLLIISIGLVLAACATTSVSPESLELAILEKDTQTIEKVLTRGVDPDTAPVGSLPPLFIAAGTGNLDAVKILLDYGADPDVQSSEGGTPVTFAIQQGFPDIAILLIEEGCSISLRNSYGQTPLMFASQYGAEDVTALLLKKGADLNAKANDGTSALFFAVAFGKVSVVDLLLEAEVDVNTANTFDQTPLMAAAAMNNLYLISKLILAGVDLNRQDNRGFSAVQYAILQGKKEAAILLIELGARTTFPFSRVKMLPRDLPADLFGHKDNLQELTLPETDPAGLFPGMIPYRIVYTEPPEENYRLAVKNLEDFLINGAAGCALFGDVLMTGPYMSRVAGRVAALESVNSTRILMRIYEADAVLEKIYINDNLFYPVNYLRNRLLEEGELAIRAPRPDELDWYWTIIPYELDDVILVIETSQSLFFLEFNDGKLIYFDDWTWLEWPL